MLCEAVVYNRMVVWYVSRWAHMKPSAIQSLAGVRMPYSIFCYPFSNDSCINFNSMYMYIFVIESAWKWEKILWPLIRAMKGWNVVTNPCFIPCSDYKWKHFYSQTTFWYYFVLHSRADCIRTNFSTFAISGFRPPPGVGSWDFLFVKSIEKWMFYYTQTRLITANINLITF